MKLKFYLYTLLALTLTIVILSFPGDCLSLALNGLNLWFERMIPTLFPFMVLSGIMIRMNLTGSFVKILNPILGRLFNLGPSCIYGIIIGFLCGFPMGAHVTAQLYEQKQISKQEASLLLAFCNNIGPVYFLSFVLPMLSLKEVLPFLIGMYGLPFLYGLFLRYILYADQIPRKNTDRTPNAPLPLMQALDESIFSSLYSIAKLGGYMIFFNLLFILGTSSAIHPIAVNMASVYDMMILAVISIVTYVFALSQKSIKRTEGIVLILLYIADVIYAIVR